MATDKTKRTSVSVLRSTKDALGSMRHPDQSNDGLIQELVKFWEKESKQYWPRRRASKVVEKDAR